MHATIGLFMCLGAATVMQWTLTDEGFIAGGHDGSVREYSNPDNVLFSPWTVTNGGLQLRLDFESSSTCPTEVSNSNVQSATATSLLYVDSIETLTVQWNGAGESIAQGFEWMSLYIDDVEVATASSPGGGGGPCNVSTVISDPSPPIVSTPLDSGEHSITISLTTRDGAYHTGAYYEFFFSLSS